MLYNYTGKVVRVIDADTLEVYVDLGFNIGCYQTLRLFGVNAWEARGEEREKGLLAKQAVVDFLAVNANKVLIETIKDKQGKYGRYLARIWINEINLNNWLVEEGHAP